jgi:hypothetical protein
MKIYRKASDGKEYTLANKGNGKETHLAEVVIERSKNREFETVGRIACGTGDYHYYKTAQKGLRSRYDPYAKDVTCEKCKRLIESREYTAAGEREAN